MTITRKMKSTNLSDQALGAIMMALQNSLLHQTDIVPVLKGFNFTTDGEGQLSVTNPPIVRADEDGSVED